MSYSSLLSKIRPYILLISICLGLIIFYSFHYLEFLAPIKSTAYNSTSILPFMIFFMLFFAFCKVELRQMKPRPWHLWCIAFQILVSLALAKSISYVTENSSRYILEGLIACIICPTAASAAVITGKLGGNESSLTSYTLLSSIAATIAVPLIFPMFCEGHGISFLHDAGQIMIKIFPMLGLPLFCAFFVRYKFPKFNQIIIANTKNTGLYLWSIALVIQTGRTMSGIYASEYSSLFLIILALVALVITVVQFCLGKFIGNFENQRISAGQGLGQKNMIVGMWITLTYLEPTVMIVPGCYIIFQNLVNAWQMWYYEKQLKYWQSHGLPVRQE